MHSHDEPAGVPLTYYEIMEISVRELLIERGHFSDAEIHRQLDVLDSRTPALGAKVIAKAWSDPVFRAELLADGRAA